VLQGCAKIEAESVTCRTSDTRPLAAPWSADHPVELIAWVRYDLAAIVIPASEQAEVAAHLPVFSLGEYEPHEPPYLTVMTLIAKGGVNPCPRIPATFREIIAVRDLYDELDDPDYYQLFGSLAADAPVMTYQSTAVPGTSGGPIIWQRNTREALVALHLGGHALVWSWGLVLGRAELLRNLQAAPEEHSLLLDREHPTISATKFAAPHHFTQPDPEVAAKIDLGLHRNSLMAMLESITPLDPFGAVSNSLQLGWLHQWWRLPFGLDTSIASRLVVAGMTGLYRSPVFDKDDRREDPLKGTAKLPFWGGFIEADAEAHFARFAPVGYMIGAGIRVGGSYLPDVSPHVSHVVWGPVVYGRLRWQFSHRLSAIGQLHLTVERIPADKRPPSAWCAKVCSRRSANSACAKKTGASECARSARTSGQTRFTGRREDGKPKKTMN
jgi:hypothetical protein